MGQRDAGRGSEWEEARRPRRPYRLSRLSAADRPVRILGMPEELPDGHTSMPAETSIGDPSGHRTRGLVTHPSVQLTTQCRLENCGSS